MYNTSKYTNLRRSSKGRKTDFRSVNRVSITRLRTKIKYYVYLSKLRGEFESDWRKYSSGISLYCSRSCSNKRIRTAESKKKTSESIAIYNRSIGKTVYGDLSQKFCGDCGREI